MVGVILCYMSCRPSLRALTIQTVSFLASAVTPPIAVIAPSPNRSLFQLVVFGGLFDLVHRRVYLQRWVSQWAGLCCCAFSLVSTTAVAGNNLYYPRDSFVWDASMLILYAIVESVFSRKDIYCFFAGRSSTN